MAQSGHSSANIALELDGQLPSQFSLCIGNIPILADRDRFRYALGGERLPMRVASTIAAFNTLSAPSSVSVLVYLRSVTVAP
jgi:hypothetical protein